MDYFFLGNLILGLQYWKGKMSKDLVRVCEEWFPLGSYKRQKLPGFPMHIGLKQQLDILIKNITNDWDFTIIITGGGEVRVGKSVLELQIMCYWAYQMWKVHGIEVPFSLEENIVFQWERLIEQGNSLGVKAQYSPLGYDEAGETMEGTKTMSRELKAVRDFLRECGQYNFLNVLVLPEFFDLPKGIAITRSIFLIDVYYVATDEGLFQRGYFRFYSRRQKKKLYLKGKKELNYNAVPYNFQGEFKNFYPIDEEEYRTEKQKALKQRESYKRDKMHMYCALAWDVLVKRFGLKQSEIIKIMEKDYHVHVPKQTISKELSDLNVNLLRLLPKK